jgi:hypothetical protein
VEQWLSVCVQFLITQDMVGSFLISRMKYIRFLDRLYQHPSLYRRIVKVTWRVFNQSNAWVQVIFSGTNTENFLLLTQIRILSKFLISLSKMHTSHNPPSKKKNLITFTHKSQELKSVKILKMFTHAMHVFYSNVQ